MLIEPVYQMISTLSEYQQQDQRVKRRQKNTRGGAKVLYLLEIYNIKDLKRFLRMLSQEE